MSSAEEYEQTFFTNTALHEKPKLEAKANRKSWLQMKRLISTKARYPYPNMPTTSPSLRGVNAHAIMDRLEEEDEKPVRLSNVSQPIHKLKLGHRILQTSQQTNHSTNR